MDFLITEHRYIDERQAKLFGDALVLSDVEGSILENNLFGVDINEESVEIAKLSLWLRTAQPNRKLNDLNSNIKCGNSLIDDVAIAGDKAFNWQNEFIQVFAKGGFDVIIGNPPYVRVQSLKEHYFDQTLYFEKKFISATGKYDLYALFMEKSNHIINAKGLISFILPHKFLIADFGTGIRKYLSKNKLVDSIIHFGSQIVFQEASTYTCIINLKRNCSEVKFIEIYPSEILNYFKFDIINLDRLNESAWNLKGGNSNLIIDEILKQVSLKDICEGIYQGLITTGDDIFMLDGKIIGDDFIGYSNEIKEEVTIEAKLMIKVLKGQDIKRNLPLNSNKYVIYPHLKNSKGKTVPIEPKEFEVDYPKAFLYLSKFKKDLTDKKIRYKTNPKYWYSLHRSREIEIFEKDYIITPQLQNIPSFTVKETEVVPDAGGYIIVPKNGYDSLTLLSVLNSKLMWFFIKNTSSEYGGGYFYFKTKYLEPFGIPNTIISNLVLKENQISQLKNTKELFVIINGFQDYMFSKLNLNSMTKKLLNWYTLESKDFLSEIIKVKKTLTITEEAQWLEYFHIQKQKALDIKSKIDATDKEIDQVVYKLYDLTEEENKIVEGA